MHQRSSNLCGCVMPVHEFKKCVAAVPNRYLGLITRPNGSKPVTCDDVAFLCGKSPSTRPLDPHFLDP
jgi:hypothetical protein